MKSKKEVKQSFLTKLLTKYRLVLLNDHTYEEKTSFKISRLNVFALLFALMFFIILITSSILFFTPIREYIPGTHRLAYKNKQTPLDLKQTLYSK